MAQGAASAIPLVHSGEGFMAEKLQVWMFGRFHVSWNGVTLSQSRTKDSHLIYLLQLLLHFREKGVSRELLEETLFGERKLTDRPHALRTALYNARRNLKKAGLPDVEYILREGDVFRWNPEIPVDEDATRFEEMYCRAEAAKAEEEKLVCFLEAVSCYKGEFLQNYISCIWVTEEAGRYRKLFAHCVEGAAELLRKEGDFRRLEELGDHAMKAEPFADWEKIKMEALVAQKKAQEAIELYADTVELYMSEWGVRPCEEMKSYLSQLNGTTDDSYRFLEDIQKDLSEDDHEGGYFCPYPVFKGIYQMMECLTEREGHSTYIMLCTIVDGKGIPMRSGRKLDELSERLGEAIRHSVRRSDAVSRYNKGQYLVLLINISREDSSIVQKRINEHFLSSRQRTGVEYHISSVLREM